VSLLCQTATTDGKLFGAHGDKLTQLMDGVIDNRNVPLLSLLVFEKVPCNLTVHLIGCSSTLPNEKYTCGHQQMTQRAKRSAI
jgi:hypothetical protein